jgi:hypothetical protein
MIKKLSYFGLAALGFLFIAGAVTLSMSFVIPIGFCAGLVAACFAARLPALRNERAALFLVLGTTLLAGSVWLLVTRVSPYMEAARDFSRMYETAAAFASGGPIPDPEYQSLFPHLKGYPIYLSFIFRLFGPSVAAAQIFNLLCSLVSAALLFSIGKKLLGLMGGLAAGLLWALMPSHFMILSLTASEPLHIMLTLFAVCGYLRAVDSLTGRRYEMLLRWFGVGGVVGISGVVRPIGPVYLIAFALCALVFVKSRRLFAAVPAMLAGYLAIAIFTSGGFGWNLYIGMNRESAGMWNAKDYAVLEARMEEGLPANDIQALFRAEGIERLHERLGEGTGFLRFMGRKFRNVWSQDSFIVYWLSQGARENSPLDIGAWSERLGNLCNLAYGFLLGCCALSLKRQLKRREYAFVLPVTILTGAVLLFLLLEANPRYHYAGSAVLCLLGAGCVIQTKEQVVVK